MEKPVIAVVDGMGGNIGHQIVGQLRNELPADIEILVFGTNSAATANMMRARASRGATGENAMRVNIGRAHIILAPLAAVIPNTYMGELTPGMAEVLASAPGEKILLPLGQPRLHVVGTTRQPLPHLMEEALARIKEMFNLRMEVSS